jgi:hypothetical protein
MNIMEELLAFLQVVLFPLEIFMENLQQHQL